MKIAVINETSAADKNGNILAALDGRGHEVVNVGMTKSGAAPELTYIHTGLMAALLLNTGRADLVVGGCGTGQGFLNSAMQYPNVFCGLITTPLDAWLFAQINGGNCVALPLNLGYGWAGDTNLKFVFDRLFSVEFGAGYPEHRRQSQAISRASLKNISAATHRPLREILAGLDESVVKPALTFPGFAQLLDADTINDRELGDILKKRIRG